VGNIQSANTEGLVEKGRGEIGGGKRAAMRAASGRPHKKTRLCQCCISSTTVEGKWKMHIDGAQLGNDGWGPAVTQTAWGGVLGACSCLPGLIESHNCGRTLEIVVQMSLPQGKIARVHRRGTIELGHIYSFGLLGARKRSSYFPLLLRLLLLWFLIVPS
jgi:hypothetical protein